MLMDDPAEQQRVDLVFLWQSSVQGSKNFALNEQLSSAIRRLLHLFLHMFRTKQQDMI